MNSEELIKKVDTAALLSRSFSEWKKVLAKDCQVYNCEEGFLAKRFDQINYKFCSEIDAKAILIDNLYALLKFKYFPIINDEIDERITKIVNSFTSNLKTTLITVSFQNNAAVKQVKYLPDYCIAFRNGVYNFKDDKWFFKYEIINLELIGSKMYLYDPSYIINWYMNYDFEDFGLNISKLSLEEFVNAMKEITQINKNYCFELMYNIAHDQEHDFSMNKFKHLCEVMGYSLLQSFSQHFVLLIGSGQNGKNSLFDGCFTHNLIPKPAANDLETIENDRFVTGSLENRYHNLFLETNANTIYKSKMIKALTGSMYQTIESKGVSKYSGILNCKYIFAGNDKDKIKFSDNTTGFRRRVNVFEIFYHWDSAKRFLKRGDYYDTSFSDDLRELKSDTTNPSAYIYFGMYGIKSATNNFTQNFKFTYNDWNESYEDIDIELKDSIREISLSYFAKMIKEKYLSDVKTQIYDDEKKPLKNSKTFASIGCDTCEDFINILNTNPELTSAYFAEHDLYISLRLIQNLSLNTSLPTTFTQNFKKAFKVTDLPYLYGNKPYAKINFKGNKMYIIK